MTTPPSSPPPPQGPGSPGPPPDPGDPRDAQDHEKPAGSQHTGGATGDEDGPRVTREEMRDLSRLRRSVADRKLAGVAGGLARHLDIDPLLVRVALVVLVFFGGAGLLLYAAGWLLVPADDEARATVPLDARNRAIALLAIGVLALLLILGDAWGGTGAGWMLGLVALAAALVWLAFTGGRVLATDQARDGGGASPPAPPTGYAPAAGGTPLAGSTAGTAGPVSASAPPRPQDSRRRGPVWFWPSLALIALALGVLGTVDLAGVRVADSAYPALALGVVAVMLLLAAVAGRGGGLILLGLLLLPVLAASMLVERVDGERLTPQPTTADQVAERYDLGAGELVLDLREVTDPVGLDGREIEVDGQVGRVEVILPPGVDTTVDARVRGPGSVRALGQQQDGFGARVRTGTAVDTPAPDLSLDATLGAGEIVVRRP